MMHNGEIETDFVSDQYVANCSCGWQSIGHDDLLKAHAALHGHYEEIRKELSAQELVAQLLKFDPWTTNPSQAFEDGARAVKTEAERLLRGGR